MYSRELGAFLLRIVTGFIFFRPWLGEMAAGA
ncbi:hypothetical protein BJQ97_00273 [Geobacillus sp. TFV-3]|nr:hypothetical protein BJQ97_00273 [Geobacillus sp. TFV-3]